MASLFVSIRKEPWNFSYCRLVWSSSLLHHQFYYYRISFFFFGGGGSMLEVLKLQASGAFWCTELVLNVKVQGTSIPPCGKSMERHHLPVTWYKIVLFLLRKNNTKPILFEGHVQLLHCLHEQLIQRRDHEGSQIPAHIYVCTFTLRNP